MSKLTAQPVLLAVEHAEGQPTKKTVDLKGVLLWAWGDVHHPKHPDGKYVVDQSFADKMIHAFHALNNGGQYFPALLVEHEADGRVYGLIIDVYTTDAGIACDMRLPAHIHAMIERGEPSLLSSCTAKPPLIRQLWSSCSDTMNNEPPPGRWTSTTLA